MLHPTLPGVLLEPDPGVSAPIVAFRVSAPPWAWACQLQEVYPGQTPP